MDNRERAQPTPENMKRARQFFHDCKIENCQICTRLAQLFDQRDAEVRLEEATWWWDYTFGTPQEPAWGVERLNQSSGRLAALRQKAGESIAPKSSK